MGDLNRQLFALIHSWTGHFVFLDWLLVFTAKYLVWFVVTVALLKVLRKKDWKNDLSPWKNRFQYFSLGFIAVLFSRGIIANLFQSLISSPRPFSALDINPLFSHAASNSLPSGHMAVLVPIVLTLFLVSRGAGWWSLFFTLLIGVARVAAGVHWPVDILLGFIIGALSWGLVYWFFRKRKLV